VHKENHKNPKNLQNKSYVVAQKEDQTNQTNVSKEDAGNNEINDKQENTEISDKLYKEKLHIWFTNADVLTKEKVLELVEEIKSGIAPDVIAICELKPKNYTRKLSELDYKIDDYHFEQEHMEDRDSSRGIALYIHKSLKYRMLKKTDQMDVPPNEMISIAIPLNNSEELNLTNIYRSPYSTTSEDDCIDDFFKAKGKIKGRQHDIVVGDFNRKEINWETLCCISKHDNFVEAIRDSYLSQKVNTPTRGRGSDEPSLIDLVFCSNSDAIEEVKVFAPLGKSDHSLLKFVYQCQPVRLPGKVVRDYNKADFTKMQEKLSRNWDLFFENCCGDVNLMWEKFIAYYDQVESECIPRKVVEIGKRRFKYNFDRSVLSKRKKKYRLWKRYMQSKDGQIYKEYCRIRNQVRRLTRKAAKQQEKEIASKAKSNSKAFWRFINSRNKLRSSVPDLVIDEKHPEHTATKDVDKANVLGRYFSKVFVREPEWLWVLDEHEKSSAAEEIDINFTKEEVREKLKNLDQNKSPGPDNLEPRALKELNISLAQPLYSIYKASLTTGKLPKSWKAASITPIYKNKGDKHLAENYRPISLTSVACKILESIIRDKILYYMKANAIISTKQYGFLGGRSTTLQLLNIMDKWTEIIDKGGAIDVIFCDFKKAFDTVPHRRLLVVLEHYGIKGPLLSWIKDFLTNRKQQVCVDGSMSEVFDVLSGVPQGSVLGPLLFIIFINLMIEKAEDANMYLYADDLKLFREIANDEDCDKLQNDVDRLYDWTRYSLLGFHPDKCETMRLGSKTKNLPNSFYTINDTRLKIVNSVKDLGITFSNVPSYEEHIRNKVNKANALVGMIRRNFEYMDKIMFKQLFVAIVRPHLEYGGAIWNPDIKNLTELIENVQRRATRLNPGMKGLSYKDRLK